jgi:cardiolipin synthase
LTQLELLVGAQAFWRRAAADFARASRRLLVQAMTFEGDSVGQMAAAAIAGSPARDRRVLVDAYSRVVVSDRWVASGDAEIRREARATDAMFRGLTAGGVGVRVTNPLGPLMANYPARNHKKLIIADDVAYVGGINFSDHNFAWRDFMVRLDGEEAAAFLAADFQATWEGAPRPAAIDLESLRIISLDGRTNHRLYAEIEQLLAGVRREVVVMSAYLTFPFTAPLAAAAARGVKVKLVTPWANNKPVVRDYLLSVAAKSGFDVHLLTDMSHCKGILIDGARLVVGSCNFDFVGHEAEEELVAVIDSAALIEDFRRRIIDPALAEAMPVGERRISPLRGRAAHAARKLAQLVARTARGARRTAVDWS